MNVKRSEPDMAVWGPCYVCGAACQKLYYEHTDETGYVRARSMRVCSCDASHMQDDPDVLADLAVIEGHA